MSDQPATPPKPKVGSLRDRIAAFEKSASSAAPVPAPAPAPRPKPAGFATWKPKVPSPPSSPPAAATTTTTPDHASSSSARAGGMSATDAKESITKAGSLKDRMAALQGKGAFGAPPPVAPKPATEKPKWKPPPVIHAPVDDDNHSAEGPSIAAAVERTLSPPTSIASRESHESPKPHEGEEEATPLASPPTATAGDNEDEAAAVDPEEEERQRRAAIAARMARLGGARVGMAPPVFGKKPPVRRPTQEEALPAPEAAKPVEDLTKAAVSTPEPTNSDDTKSPPADAVSPTSELRVAEDSRTSPDFFPKRKNSENASVLSAESAESHGTKTPTAMPVPIVPRRAGPPRKKPIKPTAPAPDVPEEHKSTAEESQEAIEEPATGTQATSPPHEQEINDEILTTPNEPTSAPISETVLPSDTENAVSESKLVSLDASARSSGTGTPSAGEEASGIASPPPSLAIDEEHDDILSGVDNADVEELPQEPHTVGNIPSEVHHHPVTLTELSVVQEVDEKLLASENAPVAATDDDEEDEAEEEARKKRIAERLAKMGGVNPLAPSPPQIKPTAAADEAHFPPEPTAFIVPHAESTSSGEKPSDKPPPSSPEPVHVTQAELPAESEVDEDGDVYEDDDERSQYESLPADFDEHHEPVKATHTSRSPPVPPSGTHPSLQVQQFWERNADNDSEHEEDAEGQTPALPVKTINNATPTISGLDPAPVQHSSPLPARPAQPPRRIIPQAPGVSDEEDEQETDEEFDESLAQSQLFVPPPPGQRVSRDILAPRRQFSQDEDGDGSENDAPALPVLQRRSMEVPAARSPSPPSDYDSEPESDHDGQALPILARNVSGHPPSTIIPPPPPPTAAPENTSQGNDPKPLHLPPIRRPIPPAPSSQPGSVDSPALPSSQVLTPTFSVSGSEEVLDEEEGDPIDPAFHSPSRRTSSINLQAAAQSQVPPPAPRTSPSGPPRSSPPPAPPHSTSPPAVEVEEKEDTEHDSEQLRRQTIAERMAKLGGIKFGAAPIPSPAIRPQPPVSPEEQEENATEVAQEETATEVLSEEEEERARKERIASKMAQMGGMRIGMMPMGMGGLPQRSHILRTESDVPKSPPLPPSAPPTRAIPPSRPAQHPAQPPPPPPVLETDSDYGSAAVSEDGVKVEVEESEPDEIDYADAGIPEEVPPPVPSRSARGPHRQETLDKATSPPLPPSRPPVPTSIPNRRSSVQATRSMSGSSAGGDTAQANTPRKSSGFMPPAQSEYVMVEEPETQEVAPPPPARPTSRVPPMRTTPQVPHAPSVINPSTDPNDSISSHWELPSIPASTIDFGGDTDLSLSWTDAGADHPAPASPPPPAPPAKKKAASTAELHLSADDLMALWGRVGVQVCEVATSIFEKSKKTLVGDGTYSGFVQSVLAMVPNAAAVPTPMGEYGYLVYMQNGPSVQKRASEIMPGDIVEIHDAKLKGHKGLQMYHQNVGGAGEVLVGVVGEFEAKKTKIRVFHANQHVGQQTVESVSYRLEDLKSGLVKVYRVLEG